MAKADDIARLETLAAQLGREADISGSAADIRQRVAELEEEIAATGKQVPEKSAATKTGDTLVRVTMLRTAHAPGFHPETDRHLELLVRGETFLVTPSCRDALVSEEAAADA